MFVHVLVDSRSTSTCSLSNCPPPCVWVSPRSPATSPHNYVFAEPCLASRPGCCVLATDIFSHKSQRTESHRSEVMTEKPCHCCEKRGQKTKQSCRWKLSNGKSGIYFNNVVSWWVCVLLLRLNMVLKDVLEAAHVTWTLRRAGSGSDTQDPQVQA